MYASMCECKRKKEGGGEGGGLGPLAPPPPLIDQNLSTVVAMETRSCYGVCHSLSYHESSPHKGFALLHQKPHRHAAHIESRKYKGQCDKKLTEK